MNNILLVVVGEPPYKPEIEAIWLVIKPKGITWGGSTGDNWTRIGKIN